MWVQWSEQREYMDLSWGCGWLLATLFVVVNLVGQLGAVAMVLTRVKVAIACGILFAVVILQTVAYSILWDIQFLFRNLALLGALLLVLAESRVEGKSLFAGVPSLGENKPKMYLQVCRARPPQYVVYQASMPHSSLEGFSWSSCFSPCSGSRYQQCRSVNQLLCNSFSSSGRLLCSQIIQNLVGSILMVLVTIGYKTKLSALVLVTWLNILNFYFNAWWTIPAYRPMRDFLKYDFFQVW